MPRSVTQANRGTVVGGAAVFESWAEHSDARWLHALVSAYHRLEGWLLPDALPGTSAYAVFRVRR